MLTLVSACRTSKSLYMWDITTFTASVFWTCMFFLILMTSSICLRHSFFVFIFLILLVWIMVLICIFYFVFFGICLVVIQFFGALIDLFEGLVDLL